MSKEVKEAKTVNFLKSKKVLVKGIHRPGKWGAILKNDVNDVNMYPGTSRSMDLPYWEKIGAKPQVFDNLEKVETVQYPGELMTQQEFFERILGLEKGALNPNKKDSFWAKDERSRVIVPREGITLDLSSPIGMIKYEILKANRDKIAPSWGARLNSPEYQFALVDDDVETDSTIETMTSEIEAMDYFIRVTSSKESMSNFMKCTGQAIPAQIKEEKLKADIFNMMKNKRSDFLKIAKDPNFEERVFLADGVICGAILKTGRSKYELPGGYVIGESDTEAIKWLLNPENIKAKQKIQYQIENYTK